MSLKPKISYIQRLKYPDPSASAQQSLLMANALAHQGAEVTYFVHDFPDHTGILNDYGLDDSLLTIKSMGVSHWPPWITRNSGRRAVSYNTLLAAQFGFQILRKRSKQPHILFVRSRLEFLYWGLLRPYLWWMKRWVFIYEAHDLEVSPPNGGCDGLTKRTRRTIQALRAYDLVLALTESLAEDIYNISDGSVKPRVVRMSTDLSRLEHFPSLDNFGDEQTVIGYLGTIDEAHGVEDIVNAVDWLPADCKIKLRGQAKKSGQPLLQKYQAADARVELLPPIGYAQAAAEIDKYDIVVASSGNTRHSKRYRSPLKIFDYMARGKPIIAAGVPAHLELLQDRVNALIYEPGNPQSLAECVRILRENPPLAQAIAQKAWEESAQYTYTARAKRILELVDEVLERRQNAR